MRTSKKLVGILFFFLMKDLSAQQLKLRPGIGFSRAFNGYVQKPTGPNFSSPVSNFNFIGNLGIEYDLNRKTTIEAAYHNGMLGYSTSVFNKGRYGYTKILFEAVDVSQFNLMFNHVTKPIYYKRIFQTNLLVRLKYGGGLGIHYFGWTGKELNEDLSYSFWVSPDGLQSVEYSTNHFKKTNNSGGHAILRGGLKLYKEKNNKELLDISFFYNQGLTKQYEVAIEYALNGTLYETKLFTRGTSAGFIVSVPITIWRRKQEAEKPVIVAMNHTRLFEK